MTERFGGIVRSLLAVVLLCATATAQGHDSRHGIADAVTADALDAIDAASAGLPAEPTQRPNKRIADWPGLIRFFAPGLIVAASIGAAGSVLGTFVLLRREALIALAIPQVVAVGAAVGMRMGWPTLPPALVAVGAALGFFVGGRRGGIGATRGTALTAPTLYVGGLCVSFLVIAHGGRHVEELHNLFTGVDVAVTPRQAAFVAPVLLFAAAAAALLWRRWLLIAQAPATAELAAVGVRRWDAVFLGLLSLVLLVGTSAQGAVMPLTMLFLPPAIVAPWCNRIPVALLAGVLAAWLCLGVAFVCSVRQEWPLSHSAGGVAFAALLLSAALRRVSDRPRGRRLVSSE